MRLSHNAISKEARKMARLTIYHIIVRESGSGDVKWIHDSWDEWTLDENPGGFDESLKKAHETHGADNVRVLEVEVPQDSFDRAFDNTVVQGEINEP